MPASTSVTSYVACPDQALSALAPAPALGEAEQRMGHLLYQGAVVLAVLLFLISFWSC